MKQTLINKIVREHYEDFFGGEANFDAVTENLLVCRLVGLDFDGTITVKGQVLVREDGQEYIIRSRKDSLLIPKVTASGVQIAVISTEENPVVKANCAKMKVECFQSIQTGENKLAILQRKARELGIRQSEVAFMGDDINDLSCLEWAGVAVCPSDSHIAVKEVVRQHQGGILLSAEGGNGALRQLTEILLLAKGCDIKR